MTWGVSLGSSRKALLPSQIVPELLTAISIDDWQELADFAAAVARTNIGSSYKITATSYGAELIRRLKAGTLSSYDALPAIIAAQTLGLPVDLCGMDLYVSGKVPIGRGFVGTCAEGGSKIRPNSDFADDYLIDMYLAPGALNYTVPLIGVEFNAGAKDINLFGSSSLPDGSYTNALIDAVNCRFDSKSKT